MAGNSNQERQRKLKEEIVKQKKIAAERQRVIKEKEREMQRLERLARERQRFRHRAGRSNQDIPGPVLAFNICETWIVLNED